MAGVTTAFGTDTNRWLAGEPVTATFELSDSINPDSLASGRVQLSSSAYGSLLVVQVTSTHTASCTFPAPFPAQSMGGRGTPR